MNRVTAILLATVCMVYCRNNDLYSLSKPVIYFPGSYSYVHRNRPYIDTNLYSSIARTDEYRVDSIVPEEATAHNDIIASSSNPLGSEEPNVTSPPPPSLVPDVQNYEHQNNAVSHETSSNERPVSLLNNALPKYNEWSQTPPIIEDDNKHLTNKPSPKVYQEQSKYSDVYKLYPKNISPDQYIYQKTKYVKETTSNERPVSPSNNALSNYNEWSQAPPKIEDVNKYLANKPAPKVYQEQSTYTDVYKLYPKNMSPDPYIYQKPKYVKEYPYYITLIPKPHQERPKYEDVYKYQSKTVSFPQHTYKRPKQPKQYKYPINVSSIGVSSEEQKQQYPSKEEPFPSKIKQERPNYQEDMEHTTNNESPPKTNQERPKYSASKKILVSPKTYQGDEYFEEAPSPPEYLAPQYPDRDSYESWPAPSFYQSLKDLDECLSVLESRISSRPDSKQNEKQFVIISGVLHGLVKIMERTPWRYYDQKYDASIPRLLKYARLAGPILSEQIKCNNEWMNQSIDKMRAVMSNRWITYICRVSDVSCDTLVLVAIDASNNVELRKQARILLALGKAAGLYVNRYAKTVERQSRTNRPSDIYTFVTESKGYFKPLIKATSEARKLLPTSLRSCYDGPLRHKY